MFTDATVVHVVVGVFLAKKGAKRIFFPRVAEATRGQRSAELAWRTNEDGADDRVLVMGFCAQIFEDFSVRTRFLSHVFGCNGRNGTRNTHLEAYCCSRILLLFCCYCSTLQHCSRLNVTMLYPRGGRASREVVPRPRSPKR